MFSGWGERVIACCSVPGYTPFVCLSTPHNAPDVFVERLHTKAHSRLYLCPQPMALCVDWPVLHVHDSVFTYSCTAVRSIYMYTCTVYMYTCCRCVCIFVFDGLCVAPLKNNIVPLVSLHCIVRSVAVLGIWGAGCGT